MSKGGAREFVEELCKNEELQRKVKNFVLAEQVITNIAAEAGYHFTSNELDAELARRWGIKGVMGEPLSKVTFSEAPGF